LKVASAGDRSFPEGHRVQMRGIVWERSPATTPIDWYDAVSTCWQHDAGNRKGWRLPTIEELSSLVDPSVASPRPKLPKGKGSGIRVWACLQVQKALLARFTPVNCFNEHGKTFAACYPSVI